MEDGECGEGEQHAVEIGRECFVEVFCEIEVVGRRRGTWESRMLLTSQEGGGGSWALVPMDVHVGIVPLVGLDSGKAGLVAVVDGRGEEGERASWK